MSSVLKNTSHSEHASIDILKLILSFLIVAINTTNIGLGGASFYVIEYVARLAVPLFFFISSYFLFYNYNQFDRTGFKTKFFKYEKNLLKLYFFWNFIYLLIIKIPEWVKTQTSIIDIAKYFYYLLIGIQYGVLWFLGSSVIGALIIWILLKKTDIKYIVLLSFLLYLVALFCFTYYPLTEPIFQNHKPLMSCLTAYNHLFSTFRNGVFDAFPFMSLGAYFALNKNIQPKTSRLVFGFVITMILLLVETVYLRSISTPYHGMMFFLYPATPIIFLLVDRIKLKSNKNFIFIRKISTYIFLTQPLSFIIKDKLLDIFNIRPNLTVQYMMLLIICIVISIIIVAFKEYANHKFNKKTT